VADILWKPLSVPQSRFLAATEDEVLYGGAKGGKKTESLVMVHLQQTDHPKYKGLVLRETFAELIEIMDRCRKYYPKLGARWVAGENRWVFPSGASVEIGYCETELDTGRYQGREWTCITYDEMGNLRSERTWDLLMGEIRSPDPTLITMARGSANPGGAGHAWIKRRYVTATQRGTVVYVDPATGLRRRFIPARVSDNPIYRNDTVYMARLNALPDVLRRQRLDGDWDAGEGMALDELSRSVHLIPPIAVGRWWYRWGALDIGFGHGWCFGHGAMDGHGNAYVIDSLHGHRDRYDLVAGRINEQVPVSTLGSIVCDNFARSEGSKGHRDRTPSVQELFHEYGIEMGNANQKRVLGLNNLRLWLGWRSADGTARVPRLRFFDTRGNRLLFECLEQMVVDPKNVEDVLKVHSDENGHGGDDPYDMLRYLMADHPFRPDEPVEAHKQLPNQDPVLFGDLTETPSEEAVIGGLSHGF
jgi:hypothetical protein